MAPTSVPTGPGQQRTSTGSTPVADRRQPARAPPDRVPSRSRGTAGGHRSCTSRRLVPGVGVRHVDVHRPQRPVGRRRAGDRRRVERVVRTAGSAGPTPGERGAAAAAVRRSGGGAVAVDADREVAARRAQTSHSTAPVRTRVRDPPRRGTTGRVEHGASTRKRSWQARRGASTNQFHDRRGSAGGNSHADHRRRPLSSPHRVAWCYRSVTICGVILTYRRRLEWPHDLR